MATLYRFKLLATNCAAAAASPTRSPTASPVIHLRRRRTLRMLLNRSSSSSSDPRRRSDRSPEKLHNIDGEPPDNDGDAKEVKVRARRRRKLKELFVSSPPPFEERSTGGDERVDLLPAAERGCGFGGGGGDGGGNRLAAARRMGSVSATFRYRFLLKRAWRPVLVTIPEVEKSEISN